MQHFIEFPITFRAESIIESRKFTRESPDCFTFVTESDIYEVDFQISFLLSKSIRDLLYSDRTCYQYFIPHNTCEKEFYDFFFNSLSSNTIQIPINYFREFVSISQILQIECFQQSIEKAILFTLCDPSDQNKDDNQKFAFLCENIRSIDMDKLKKMPDWFINKLLSNAIFNNEDDRALFLIQNREYLGIEYFEQINFDDVSKSILNEIITILEENSDITQEFISKLINRLKIELSHVDIYLLNISSHVKEKPTLDLNFLYELNRDKENKKYSIYYKTLYDVELGAILNENKNYLKSFDVVVLGGIDGFGYYFSESFKTSIFDALEKYRKEGGIVLALHDVAFANSYKIFEKLYKESLGFSGDEKAICKNSMKYDFYKSAQFIESSGKNDMIKCPFKIEKSFKVAKTHSTLIIDPKYKVFDYFENSPQHYYAENLEQNFADSAMCHTTSITITEKKLFYNTICHLYESCHNHIPNSI